MKNLKKVLFSRISLMAIAVFAMFVCTVYAQDIVNTIRASHIMTTKLRVGSTMSDPITGYIAQFDGNVKVNSLTLPLASGKILLGNGSGVAAAQTVSGDITLSSSGVAAIASGVIVNADINASAAIADSKLATIATAGKVSDTALSSNVFLYTSPHSQTTAELAVSTPTAIGEPVFNSTINAWCQGNGITTAGDWGLIYSTGTACQ